MTIRQVARPKVECWPNGAKGGKIDLSSLCFGFEANKSISQSTGKWTINLLPRQGSRGPAALRNRTDLERIIRPNSVISIGMDEPGGIMFGLVDEVRPTRRFGDTARQALTITGSDFGKTLSRDHIVRASLTVRSALQVIDQITAVTGPTHSLVEALPGVWGPVGGRDATPTFIGKQVEDVVKWLLTHAPSMSVPLLAATGGTGRPGEFINTDNTITTWNDGRIWSEAPHTYQGTVWDFLRRILDEDFYECWLDTTPTGSAIPQIDLIIRPKPFDEPALSFLPTGEELGIDWLKLRTRIDGLENHEFQEREILQEELGFTDEDVYAFYLVTTQHALLGNTDGLKEGLYYPAIDTFALANTGLRSYEGSLSLLSGDVARKQAGDADYDRDVGFEVVEFRNRLVNWYRANGYMEAGSFTVPGRDRIRVGDPLFRPGRIPSRGFDKGTRYYCVGTKHSWQLGAPYTVNCRVMRGHNTSVISQFALDVFEDAGRFPGASPTHLAVANQ